MNYKIGLLLLALLITLSSCTKYNNVIVVNYCDGKSAVIHATSNGGDFIRINNSEVAVPELLIGGNTIAYNVCSYLITETTQIQ